MTDRVSKIILRGDISDLQAKLVAAGKSLQTVADKATAATAESRKFRQGLDTAGNAAGKMALVTGAAFVGIVASAANFDQAMSRVAAATHETTQNMDLLRDAALEAGKRTVFSATEAAAAVENLAKAGVQTQDILAGGLDGALDLAAAGSLDVADAAEIAATAMTQFGLKGKDVPHVADLLAAAAGKAQGEVSDMSFALKQSGLVADQMGVSIEETTGTLAAFASAGLLGSDAGTSFRTMLLRLANPSKTAALEMEHLGIAAYDAQGNFVGIQNLAGQLQKAFQGQTQATRDAALATIFGSDAIRAANVLYKQGAQGIADWTDKVNDQGFAAETAAIKLDNLKGDLEQLRGALETLLITGGEGSQGFLRGATQRATDFVNVLNEMPPELKGLGTSLLGITAITGGALWFGSKVVRGIANTREALDQLGSAGTRAGRALGSVTRAAAAVAVIEVLDSAIDGLERSMADALPSADALAGKLLDLRDGRISALGDQFKDLGDDLQFFKQNAGASSFFDKIPNITGLLPGENAIERVHRVTRETEALDDALASLANSGSADQAQAAFNALTDSENLNAQQRKILLEQLPQYRDALDAAKNAARLAAGGEATMAGAADRNTQSIEDQTKAIADNIDKMREKRSLAIAAENAEIGYQQALDDAAAALKENGKTLDITTEKGRANKSALLDVASAWNDLGDAEKNQKGARQQAIQTFVDLATQMGMGEKAARRLAERLLEIPPRVVTQATIDTQGAQDQLDRFIKRNDGRKIHISADGSGFTFAGGFASTARAEGGPIYGPGTKTSDSIPAWLSNGEFVVKAAAVERYGLGFLHAVNSMHFAEGGFARRGEQHGARTYMTTNNYYANASGRSGPAIAIGTVTHQDMRETARYLRNISVLAGDGWDGPRNG